MKAQPLYRTEHAPTHHWRGGIAGYEEYPELCAIVKAARKCYERPLYFAVGEKIYTLSSRVWRQIKQKNPGLIGVGPGLEPKTTWEV